LPDQPDGTTAVPPKWDPSLTGNRIYMARHAQRGEDGKREMSQSELAAKVNAAQTTISSLELGKVQSPGIALIFDIATALEVTPAYLLGLSDYSQRSHEFMGLNDDERELLRIFRRLDALMRVVARRVVAALE
jgi:transcriptional regulator with XRE-family HTH domain